MSVTLAGVKVGARLEDNKEDANQWKEFTSLTDVTVLKCSVYNTENKAFPVSHNEGVRGTISHLLTALPGSDICPSHFPPSATVNRIVLVEWTTAESMVDSSSLLTPSSPATLKSSNSRRHLSVKEP